MTFIPRNKPSIPTQSHLRAFYFLALAQTISQIGSSMTFLAVGIYVYYETRQATPLALLSMFLLLPRILVSGITGAMADRYSRRAQMLIGDCGAAMGLAGVAWSITSGNFQLWHLYAVALWQAFFSTM
jgi:MFS family permease